MVGVSTGDVMGSGGILPSPRARSSSNGQRPMAPLNQRIFPDAFPRESSMIRNASAVFLALLCTSIALASAADGEIPPNVHWWVVQHTEAGQRADFFIVLKTQANVSTARALDAKADKGRFVFSALTRTAQETQGPV